MRPYPRQSLARFAWIAIRFARRPRAFRALPILSIIPQSIARALPRKPSFWHSRRAACASRSSPILPSPPPPLSTACGLGALASRGANYNACAELAPVLPAPKSRESDPQPQNCAASPLRQGRRSLIAYPARALFSHNAGRIYCLFAPQPPLPRRRLIKRLAILFGAARLISRASQAGSDCSAIWNANPYFSLEHIIMSAPQR